MGHPLKKVRIAFNTVRQLKMLDGCLQDSIQHCTSTEDVGRVFACLKTR